MARAIVGNRATSGSDQRPTDVLLVIAIDDRSYDQSWRPIVRSIVKAGDRWYDQTLPPATDPTSNRGVQRSIARSILASCDRSYDQSLLPTTERIYTINRGNKRPIVDQS